MLLVLAADHLITKVDNFHAAIQTAISFAENNQLVTFGIIPEHLETGYGYIKRGEHLPMHVSKLIRSLRSRV